MAARVAGETKGGPANGERDCGGDRQSEDEERASERASERHRVTTSGPSTAGQTEAETADPDCRLRSGRRAAADTAEAKRYSAVAAPLTADESSSERGERRDRLRRTNEEEIQRCLVDLGGEGGGLPVFVRVCVCVTGGREGERIDEIKSATRPTKRRWRRLAGRDERPKERRREWAGGEVRKNCGKKCVVGAGGGGGADEEER